MATLTKLITITGAIASDITTAYAYPLDAGGDSSGTVIAASAAEILSVATKTKSYVVSVTCDNATELVGPWIVGLGSIGGYEPFAEVPFVAGSDVYRASGGVSASSGGTVGSGSETFTQQFTDGTDPIQGVEVWITTDASGDNVVAGTLYTDTSGNVTFMLDPGDYYLWFSKSKFNSSVPVEIRVPPS